MRERPSRVSAGFFSIASILVGFSVAAPSECIAEPYRLAPNTKVQVSVVQWNASKGAYERWDALGGVFQVSVDGTLSLPLLGSINAGGQSASQLAGDISMALKSKVGLLASPAVSVEVTAYPPVYVVGAVSAPGQYEFTPGMTVLQAVALGGGRYRQSQVAAASDTISLLGELATIQSDILRTKGRIARLEAEQSGAPNLIFPVELSASSKTTLAGEIVSLEKTIFIARTREIQRQLAALAASRDLYDQELEVLRARTDATIRSIDLLKAELEAVETLFKRGLVTASRRSGLEQTLTAVQVTRLSQDTELMKLRQAASELSRQELTIHDQRQTSIAIELRDAGADLDRLATRQDTLERLLRQTPPDPPSIAAETEALAFSIVRAGEKIKASEITEMYPGDVLKVDFNQVGGPTDMSQETSAPIEDELSEDLAALYHDVGSRRK